MAAYLVIGNRRVKFRFFIILALLIGGIFYLLTFHKSASAYSSISYGKLDMVYNGFAVIIRDEKVYTAPAHGKAVFLVSEGSRVETNQPVAVLYKENYDEVIVKQLYDIQEKIIEYQQNRLMDQVVNSDLITINEDIDSSVSQIQELVSEGKYSSLGVLESQLRVLLENKQKLLDYQTEPDFYLTELYNREASLMAQIEAWTIRLQSPSFGYISFFVDGWEHVIDKDSIGKITLADLENIFANSVNDTSKSGFSGSPALEQETAEVQMEEPFFKIVDPSDEWYAVLKCDDSEIFLQQGDIVEAVFDDQEKMSAIVTHVHKENNQSILVLQFSTGMDKIISKRVSPLEIRKTVEGLMVPTGALHNNRGVQGVYVKDKDKNIFIETSIQALSNGFAIVESVSDEQALQLHDQVLNDKE